MKNLADSSEGTNTVKLNVTGKMIQKAEDLNDEKIQELMNENTLQNVADLFYTKAGETRKEMIEFFDQNGDHADHGELSNYKITFCHNKNYSL